MLQAKHAIKHVSLEDLGKGRSRGGGVFAKRRRWEVLDRLSRLGQGLSPAQRNDLTWFKNAWGARMLQEHGGEWPETFTGWMQRLLEDNEKGFRMHFPFSFIPKRVDVSMGCHLCESHDFVMVAVAAMRLGQSLGQWDAHQSVLWALVARQGDPTTRPTFPESRTCHNDFMARMRTASSSNVVAACSWPQSRLAIGSSYGLHLAAVAACCRHAVASSDARGMRGHAVAAFSCVFRRVRVAVKKFAHNE